MRKTIIAFLILAVNITAHSQNKCECSKTLKELIVKVENEYPGFNLKTKDSIAYESIKNHLMTFLAVEYHNTVRCWICLKLVKKATCTWMLQCEDLDLTEDENQSGLVFLFTEHNFDI